MVPMVPAIVWAADCCPSKVRRCVQAVDAVNNLLGRRRYNVTHDFPHALKMERSMAFVWPALSWAASSPYINLDLMIEL